MVIKSNYQSPKLNEAYTLIKNSHNVTTKIPSKELRKHHPQSLIIAKYQGPKITKEERIAKLNVYAFTLQTICIPNILRSEIVYYNG